MRWRPDAVEAAELERALAGPEGGVGRGPRTHPAEALAWTRGSQQGAKGPRQAAVRKRPHSTAAVSPSTPLTLAAATVAWFRCVLAWSPRQAVGRSAFGLPVRSGDRQQIPPQLLPRCLVMAKAAN